MSCWLGKLQTKLEFQVTSLQLSSSLSPSKTMVSGHQYCFNHADFVMFATPVQVYSGKKRFISSLGWSGEQ